MWVCSHILPLYLLMMVTGLRDYALLVGSGRCGAGNFLREEKIAAFTKSRTI